MSGHSRSRTVTAYSCTSARISPRVGSASTPASRVSARSTLASCPAMLSAAENFSQVTITTNASSTA